jgi:3-deoxy-manno-octulosonate cytidylyltransferase (CMP-KDO synthetase)
VAISPTDGGAGAVVLSPPFHIVIPARLAATRLPGKPLLPINGRPLIQWVWDCARASRAASITIATDDEQIRTVASSFGADVMLTAREHASGTDRIAEVVRARGLEPGEIVVNLQGDEPLTPPTVLDEVAQALAERAAVDIATVAGPIESLEEFLDPSCVKAVCAPDGSALYFSRAPVPWPRDQAVDGRPASFAGAWRHIGIYAYRAGSLLRFAAWPPTPLEVAEKLEQLRALEHGMRIHVVKLAVALPAGVDTPEDLDKVRDKVRAVLRAARASG